MAHAEVNAISNAVLTGTSVNGCIMYTNGTPCVTCARTVINAGIKGVIVDAFWDKDNDEKWVLELIRTEEMFNEAGIWIRKWNTYLIPVNKFKRGEIIGVK